MHQQHLVATLTRGTTAASFSWPSVKNYHASTVLRMASKLSVLWVFPLVICIIIVGFFALWAWSTFIESAKPASARLGLYITLLVIAIGEIMLWYFDFLRWYAVIWMGICNFWGMLDAILRYPVVHDLDSMFSIKQIVLLGTKTMVFGIGYNSVSKTPLTFILALFLCNWTLPLMYVMALPIGDTRMQSAKTDRRDMDIMVKVYGFFFREDEELDRWLAVQKAWWKDAALHVLVKIPGVRNFLAAQGLVDQRQLRAAGKPKQTEL